MTTKTDRPSAAVRIRVYKRDRFTCTYCGKAGNEAELEVDHIVPISKGGSNHMSNLTTACRGCNQKKGNDTKMRPSAQNFNGGLSGLFLHVLDEFGEILNQGYIKAEVGEFLLIQLFSFMDGRETEIRPFNKEKLLNGGAKFYPNNQEMNFAYHKWEKEKYDYSESGLSPQQLTRLDDKKARFFNGEEVDFSPDEQG